MAEPDYAAWEADPRSLLTFLDDNLIATGLLQNAKLNSMPEYLVLKKTATRVVKDGKEAGWVYYLKNSDETSSANAIKAYICDYEKNNTKYALLADKAKFCFTITMNGCTFGIGMPNSSGDVIVSHSNRAADINQAATQRDITLGGHKNGQVTMLEPSLYRPAEKMACTTFGLRAGRNWSFHFQSYRANGGTFEYFGTMPITTQSQAA
jgi:hypothetical protein